MKKDWTDVLKQKLENYVPDDMQLPGFEDIRQKMLAAKAAAGVSGGAEAGAGDGAAAGRRRPLRWLAYAASLAAVVAGGALLLRNNNGDSNPASSVAEAVTDNSAANDSGRVYVVESAAEDAADKAIAEAAQADATPAGKAIAEAAQADATPAGKAIAEAAPANNALAEAAPSKAAGSAGKHTLTATGKADGDAPKAAVPASEDAIGGDTPDVKAGNSTEQADADNLNDLLAEATTDSNTDSNTDSKTGSDTGAAPTRDIYSGGNADPLAEPVEPIRKQLKKFSLGASGILAANGTGKSARNGEALNAVTAPDGQKYIGLGAPELQYHYTAPVSGGLSLRYQLTNQFYAETGLRFTYLRTWVSPTGAHQNLLYAGIPVGVGCKFVQLGKFDIYGSAYGMASKCIAGSESTNFPYNYVLSEIPVMWSAGVAPGAEYHFGQLVSLYAEPTLSYYFKNEKAPQTLYKENPLYFTVNIGVRFNL